MAETFQKKEMGGEGFGKCDNSSKRQRLKKLRSASPGRNLKKEKKRNE
jgi:hypothetical protein